VPDRARRCPNCRAARPTRSLASRLGLIAGPIGGGAIALTLMACYGMPPCADGSLSCYEPPDAGADVAEDSAVPLDAAHPHVGDAAPDAAPDATPDAEVDGGIDAEVDAMAPADAESGG
jgi:hypothetical protein